MILAQVLALNQALQLNPVKPVTALDRCKCSKVFFQSRELAIIVVERERLLSLLVLHVVVKALSESKKLSQLKYQQELTQVTEFVYLAKARQDCVADLQEISTCKYT